MSTISLNERIYPLVVGNADKYTFSDWENCGSSVRLQPEITDSVFQEQDVCWQSENPEIAVVEEGLVRAKRTGRTRVTAVLPDGAAAACEILVIDNMTRGTVQRIELNTSELVLQEGKTAQLYPFVFPWDLQENGAVNTRVRFEAEEAGDVSGQPGSCVRVSEEGEITALAPGEAWVSVLSEDVGRKARCHIKVAPITVAPTAETNLYGILLDRPEKPCLPIAHKLPTAHELRIGETLILKAITDEQKPRISWASDRPAVADVDKDGVLTAYGVGRAVIYATAVKGGACRRMEIEVEEKRTLREILLSAEELYLTPGEKGRISALADPGTFVLPAFRWESSDPQTAVIKEKMRGVCGEEAVLIEGLRNGCCEIIVSLGGRRKNCRICVTEENRGETRKKIQKETQNETQKETQNETQSETQKETVSVRIRDTSETLEIDEIRRLEATLIRRSRAQDGRTGGGEQQSEEHQSEEHQSEEHQSKEHQSKEHQNEEHQSDARMAKEASFFWLSTNRSCITVNREGILKGYGCGTADIYCISEAGLKGEQRRILGQLARIRSLAEDARAMRELRGILGQTVYGKITLRIPEEMAGDCCLRNLHIPPETVCQDSICLLWNRASLLETGDFAHYRVSCRQKETGDLMQEVIIEKLGHTFRNLQPDTDYLFQVQAETAESRILKSRRAEGRTKMAASVLDVTAPEFGARGDGRVLDTLAIQKAIDACPQGGRVLLPEGKLFYSGALFLKSNMTLQVDGILLGSENPADYPPVVTRWEGWRKLEQTAAEWANTTAELPENHYQHASLLNAGIYDEGESGRNDRFNLHDLVICGSGMVNGNGFRLAYNEGPNHYDKDGGEPVPPSIRRDPTSRGRVLLLQNAERVYVKDLLIAYGPSWTIHTIFCDGITFDGLKIISRGTGRTGAANNICILNGDGIDPESSTNVVIFDCFFFTGDDAVAVKSGRNREGNELEKPTAYLRVTDCASVGSKGGFCIGSEIASGAHDILWQNLLVDDVLLFGLWVKSSASRGGLIENILWRDCVLGRTQGAIFVEDGYRSCDANPARELPEICDQIFENIRCEGFHNFGIRIVGLPDAYIHDILFRSVTFEEVGECDGRAFEVTCGQNIRTEDVALPPGKHWKLDQVSTLSTVWEEDIFEKEHGQKD